MTANPTSVDKAVVPEPAAPEEKAIPPQPEIEAQADTEQGAAETPPGAPYSVFPLRQKWTIVMLLGYLGLASSLTANIYIPLTEQLSQYYRVSTQDINLTITLFFVFQGISPSFWSPLSDVVGRRPIYLATFTVFTLASLGLSIPNRSYPALLLLRAMQSVGGSAVLSIAYASIADLVVHAERGRFLSPMMTAANIGPFIGPVLGGAAVLPSGSPIWCFRALLVFGASSLLLIGFLLPETGRSVVGNGAVPAKGVWRTWWAILARRRQYDNTPADAASDAPDNAPDNVGKTGRGRMVMPNPLASLRILLYPDAFLCLYLVGAPYASAFAMHTTMSPIFNARYGFPPLVVGCFFMVSGVGTLLGGVVAGWLLDRNYGRVARAHGLPVDRVRGLDLAGFPIEQARARLSIRIVAVTAVLVVGYGWAVAYRVHPAVPVLLGVILRALFTTTLQTYSALIVDVFPDRPGTAAASNNIVRCGLSAVIVAAVDPLIRAMGYGWFFTLLALAVAVTCTAAVLALRRWGRAWRDKRDAQESP